MKRPILLVVAIAAAVSACGDDEDEEPPPPPPPERCQADNLKAYAEGAIANEDESASLDISSNDVSGRIFDGGEVRLQLGDASPPGASEEYPLILRIVDNEDDPEFVVLGERLDMATEADPLEFHIVDSTDYSGLGSEDLTSLSDYDCSIDADGTVCAQLGFDTSGSGNLGDDDDYVYNAAGGTVTVEGFSTADERFAAHWDIEVGPNIFAFQDESSGEFEGCMWPHYDPRAPGNYWSLE